MKIIDLNGKEKECEKAYPDPDWPGYMRVEYKNPRRSYHVWYPIEEFKKNNPNLEGLVKDAYIPPPEITGIVSSSTDITLTDKTQSWVINTYAGFPVWISKGQGEGQVRTVLSNTYDTLVIDKKWDTKLNKFSQYVLSRNIHEQMRATGNISAQEIQHQYKLKAKKINQDRKKTQKLIEAA